MGRDTLRRPSGAPLPAKRVSEGGPAKCGDVQVGAQREDEEESAREDEHVERRWVVGSSPLPWGDASRRNHPPGLAELSCPLPLGKQVHSLLRLYASPPPNA